MKIVIETAQGEFVWEVPDRELEAALNCPASRVNDLVQDKLSWDIQQVVMTAILSYRKDSNRRAVGKMGFSENLHVYPKENNDD